MFRPQAKCHEILTCDVSLRTNFADNSSNADSPNIYIYDAREDAAPLLTAEKLHSRPVHVISYNPIYDCVVSVDTSGMLEYWQPTPDFSKPKQVFEFKSKTDLYDFKKVFTTRGHLI